MGKSIGSVGCSYGQRGNRTEPVQPSIISPAEAGCGDYDKFVEYEARMAAKERQHIREERFTPCDGLLPDGVSGDMVPTPWAAEFYERREIASELVDRGVRRTELDAAIDREMWRRRVDADRQRLGGIIELYSIL